MRKGSKVKYLGEDNWAYDHNGIYEVAGYDEELDAWGLKTVKSTLLVKQTWKK